MPKLTDLQKARRLLSRRDPVLKKLTKLVGPCTLSFDRDHFGVLVRSIISSSVSGRSTIGLHLVGDNAIRALNAEHRGLDVATDVLSFPLIDLHGAEFAVPPDEATNLGDVVVSYHRAIAQAEEFGHSVDREIAYLVAHGVISGYGDCTFRPYNNTTRGQMVKIVVLGFGLPITTPTPGGYTFTDVPRPGSL